MRILVATTSTRNSFLGLFLRALNKHPDVSDAVRDLDAFWTHPGSADVLHIHWPEAMFENWEEPDDATLTRLDKTLQEWAVQTPVVATVHNMQPHYANTSVYRRLYRLVYSYAYSVIHLGEESRRLFEAQYPDLGAKPQAVIPHGAYSCFDNEVTEDEARQHLGLNAEDTVCLAFGQIRHFREMRLLFRGFRRASIPGKRLYLAGKINSSVRRPARWYYRLQTMVDPRIQSNSQFIPDHEVQYYLNAADMLVIPRLEALNSGNMALGFTFGRVVVGPDVGVVGEILRATGNPVYDPRRPNSLGKALERASKLRRRGKGQENAAYARSRMDWSSIAQQHVALYDKLIASRPQEDRIRPG
jgi:glycosyltransferase involved in cell wall biosynthesis